MNLLDIYDDIINQFSAAERNKQPISRFKDLHAFNEISKDKYTYQNNNYEAIKEKDNYILKIMYVETISKNSLLYDNIIILYKDGKEVKRSGYSFIDV